MSFSISYFAARVGLSKRKKVFDSFFFSLIYQVDAIKEDDRASAVQAEVVQAIPFLLDYCRSLTR